MSNPLRSWHGKQRKTETYFLDHGIKKRIRTTDNLDI
jgi:hypothetical protein